MATFTKEFEPLEHISRILTLWWVIVICAVLGGAAGLIIHQFKPPLYEAQAVFMASIDFTKIDFSRSLLPSNPYQFSQYDEDISLALVEASLRHVEPQVVTFAQNNNLAMDVGAIEDMSTIERKHAFWYLRFRSSDPAIAQKVVNYWAQTGLADLKTKKAQKTTHLAKVIVIITAMPQIYLAWLVNLSIQFAKRILDLTKNTS